MPLPSSFQAEDAKAMLTLAELACTDLSVLFLPSPWQLIQTFSTSYGQGFYAQGDLPASGETTAVLAVGIPWSQYIYQYLPILTQFTAVNGLIAEPSSSRTACQSPSLAFSTLLLEAAAALGPELGSGRATARGLTLLRPLSAGLHELIERTHGSCCSACGKDTASSARIRSGLRLASGWLGGMREAMVGDLDGHRPFDAAHFLRELVRLAGEWLEKARELEAQDLLAVNYGQVDAGYMLFYKKLQAALWSGLKFTSELPDFSANFPLMVTGIGVGAPLAQLAALDVSPIRLPTASPVDEMQVYSFSNPNFGNSDFAKAFSSYAPNAYNLSQNADFFPSNPAVGSSPPLGTGTYARAGEAVALKVGLPQYDSPWLERSRPYYEKALDLLLDEGRTPAFARRVPASALLLEPDSAARERARPAHRLESSQASSAAFDGDLAYTLAQSCSYAYLRFQHPNLQPPQPYQDLTAAGVTWGAIFEYSNQWVATFRGSVSWMELSQILCDSTQETYPYDPAGSTAQVHRGILNLYSSLREDLRAKLAALGNGKPLQFTGHGEGGALASLAALDLKQNPIAGAPLFQYLYIYGTSPLGNTTFAALYDAALAGASFLVKRPLDIFPGLSLKGVYVELAEQQVLQGGNFSPDNTPTYHPISNYIELLNPFAAAVEQPPEEAASGHHIARVLELLNLRRSEQTRKLYTGDYAGGLRISWLGSRSDLTPVKVLRQHEVSHYADEIQVARDSPLIIESEFGEPLVLVVGKLTLEAGARLELRAEAKLYVGTLVTGSGAAESGFAEPSTIEVSGVSGSVGAQGPAGQTGSPGPMGKSGGSGSSGGAGGSGGKGTMPERELFHFDQIVGTLTVTNTGGNGGAGGAGGKGGNGGDGGGTGKGGNGGSGGAGGEGGAGADGTTVVIRLNQGASGQVINEMSTCQGGVGGSGGAGGQAGQGTPDGKPGTPGSPGLNGLGGKPPVLVVLIDP